jgi:hypothetical protein
MTARGRGESGQVTPFVTVLTLALLLCAGLVVDGGRVLAARRQAADLAASAARAGAQAVSIDELRTTNRQLLDPAEATEAAQHYLDVAGHPDGDVSVSGDSVEVRVRLTTPLVILRLVGLGERTVTGSGRARSVRGNEEADQ